MRAIRIHHFGKSEELKLEETPQPQPQQGQVLVKVFDAGVNPIDWKMRANLYHNQDDSELPITMGQDFAGVVVSVGDGVHTFLAQDRVFGFATGGSYAEFSLCNQEEIAVLPPSLDFAVGAALPTAGLTAWQMVMETAAVNKNMTVLIHGAAGGVGSFAVQLCRWINAAVIVTASTDDFPYLKSIGAQKLIDYKNQRFEDQMKDIDVVIDLIGKEISARSLPLLKPGGMIINTTHTLDVENAKKQGVRGVNFTMKRDGKALSTLARLTLDGVLSPRMGQTLPLSEAAQAQDLSEKGRPHGKLILEVNGQ